MRETRRESGHTGLRRIVPPAARQRRVRRYRIVSGVSRQPEDERPAEQTPAPPPSRAVSYGTVCGLAALVLLLWLLCSPRG
jgi:hypothetical protein